MKSYKSSCAKDDFVAIKKAANGQYIVRWNPVESTEGEGEEARTIVTFNENVVDKKPSYGDVVTLIIRDRYTESDEIAMGRQSYAKVEDFTEYNAYVEQAKKWACAALGKTYTPCYEPTNAEVLTQVRTLLKGTAQSLPDEQAESVPSLFDPWENGVAYAVGDRRYNAADGKLYKCVQAHTSQADWRPDLVPALWTVIHTEEWPDWAQPTGAQDAYAKDSKVSHAGKHWISSVDANVWEPGVYGWTQA